MHGSMNIKRIIRIQTAATECEDFYIRGMMNCIEYIKKGHGVSVVKCHLTLRRLMSYIYGAPILDVSRSHTTTQHSR